MSERSFHPSFSGAMLCCGVVAYTIYLRVSGSAYPCLYLLRLDQCGTWLLVPPGHHTSYNTAGCGRFPLRMPNNYPLILIHRPDSKMSPSIPSACSASTSRVISYSLCHVCGGTLWVRGTAWERGSILATITSPGNHRVRSGNN